MFGKWKKNFCLRIFVCVCFRILVPEFWSKNFVFGKELLSYNRNFVFEKRIFGLIVCNRNFVFGKRIFVPEFLCMCVCLRILVPEFWSKNFVFGKELLSYYNWNFVFEKRIFGLIVCNRNFVFGKRIFVPEFCVCVCLRIFVSEFLIFWKKELIL